MRRPAIVDPQAIAVVGTGAHLPRLPLSSLQPQAIRDRLANPPAWAPEFTGDPIHDAQRASRQAAVLVPLVDREDGLQVLLTRRSSALRDHAGQIAFPGGRVEPTDADVVATALREAQEEIGLAPAWVDVLGSMPSYHTVTDFAVTPVVALVRPGFSLRLDAAEVSEAFEVPLAHLMDPAGHRRHAFEHAGHPHEFLSMPWSPPGAADGRAYFIWGATAGMLRNLYRLLGA